MKINRIIPRFILLFFIIFNISSVNAQVSVSKVSKKPSNPADEGIFYSLPHSIVNVAVVVNKIQRIKGPYSDYAERYLGITDIISASSTEYQVAEIRLSTSSEPDPNEYYFIKMPDKSSKGSSPTLLYFSDNGMVSGSKIIEPETADNGLSYQLSGQQRQMRDIFNPTVTERIDTIIKRVSVDTTTVEQKIFRKVSSAKTIDQKAKEAADFILKMDESKFNLINGYQEVNYEKGTIEFMYKQMDELENNYLQMFKGITEVTTQTYIFSFIPQKENSEKAVTLCKFSKTDGVLDKAESKGDPLTIQATNLNVTDAISTAVTNRSKDDNKAKGYFYRIPDQAQVSVKIGNQTKMEGKFQINQYGLVTFLPANLVKTVELYSKTGSLKQIILK